MHGEIGIARFPIFPKQRGDGDAKDKPAVIFSLGISPLTRPGYFREPAAPAFPEMAFVFRGFIDGVSLSREYYHKRLT